MGSLYEHDEAALLNYISDHRDLDVDIVRGILESEHVDVNYQDREGQTALVRLCGSLANVRTMIEVLVHHYGADPDLADNNGKTPLHHAVTSNTYDAVLALLDCGASVEEVDSEERTALHLAATNGSTWIAETLCDYGADPAIGDYDDWTPLHSAASNHNVTLTTRFLLDYTADLSATTIESGNTPLHLASFWRLWRIPNRGLQVIKLLVKHGGDLSITNNDGQTTLHIACGWGTSKVCKYFVEEHGMDPDLTDRHGNTSFHHACKVVQPNVVRYLARQVSEATILAPNKEGKTAFELACERGRLDTIFFFLRFLNWMVYQPGDFKSDEQKKPGEM